VQGPGPLYLNGLLSALAFCQHCRLTLSIGVLLDILAVILGGVRCSHEIRMEDVWEKARPFGF
jgi:hypothetical protein